MVDVVQRAREGAKFLDKVEPGWYRKVNPLKLDMRSCVDCVLGQLYGEFILGMETLMRRGLGYHFLWFGFATDELKHATFSGLTIAWSDEIHKRQHQEREDAIRRLDLPTIAFVPVPLRGPSGPAPRDSQGDRSGSGRRPARVL